MNSHAYKLIFALLSFSLLAILVLQGFWIRNFYVQKTDEFNRTVYAAMEQLTQKLNERESMQALKMTYIIQNGDTIVKTPSRHMSIASFNQVKVINNDREYVTTTAKQTPKNFVKHIDDSINISRTSKGVNIFLTGKKTKIQAGEPKNSLKDLVKASSMISEEAKDVDKLIDKMITEIKVIDVEDNNVDTLTKVIKRIMFNKGIFIPFEFSLRKLMDGKKKVLAQSSAYEDQKPAYKSDLSADKIFNTHKFLFLQLPDESSYVLASIKNMLVLSIIFSLLIMGVFYYTMRLIMNQKKLGEIKNDFVNNMTHELKTPIATNSLAIDALANPVVKNDETKFKDYIRILKEENQKLNVHVERVLQMALLDKGSLPLNKQPVNLVTIIRAAIESYKLQIDEQKTKVNFNPPSETIMINADEQHLQTVFSNLLDNALKYSREPCVVDIHIDNEDQNLIIRFKDNGIGIAKEHREKIFDKFYRAQGGNLHDVKGFGLGLSYVKSIVEAHQGGIELRSESGKGSEFIMIMKT